MPETKTLRSRGFLAFLATQFLGAFNDNVFKLLICLFAVSRLADPGEAAFFVPLAAAVFTAPFLIFLPYAGFLADRFSKKRIMVWVKAAEVVIMCAGVLSFLAENLNGLLGVLFLMGAQSAFFGPAKYGFLPETLPDEDLSLGNGYVQMWTFLAVILGGAAGGRLSDVFAGRVYIAAAACIVIAVVGLLTSVFITRTPEGHAGHRFEPNSFRILWRTVNEMRRNRALYLCVLGTAYFWFLGALFQVNILVYAKNLLQSSDSFVGVLQAVVAFGMGVGSTLAGRWSGKKVEFGLVPIGGVGITVFCIMLAFSTSSPSFTLITAFLLGSSAGLFNIPLSTFIQQQSPDDSRGRFLATNNFLSFAAMTLSYVVLGLLSGPLQRDPGEVFFIVGLVTAGVLVLMLRSQPDLLVRTAIWCGVRLTHRVRVEGIHRVPMKGGALIVCNHLSWMDGLLVKIAFQRPVRFLILRRFFGVWWLRPFLKVMNAIPISPDDGPKALVGALHRASEQIREGELVCIFPEGGISRTGTMLGFGKGIRAIVKGVDAPILPVCLDRLWGSLLGMQEGRLKARFPWPRSKVTVSIGDPLPGNTPTEEIRTAVAELAAEAYCLQETARDHLADRVFRRGGRARARVRFGDAEGKWLTRARFIRRALAMGRALRRGRGDGGEALVEVTGNGLDAALAACAAGMAGAGVRANAPGLADRGVAPHAADCKDLAGQVSTMDRTAAWLTVFGHAIPGLRVLRTGLRLPLLAGRLPGLRTLSRCLERRVAGLLHARGWRPPDGGDAYAHPLCRVGPDPFLSHGQVVSHAELLMQILRLKAGDRVVATVPFSTPFGMSCGLWLPLLEGLGVTWVDEDQPHKLGAILTAERPRLLVADSATIRFMLREVDGGALGSGCTLVSVEPIRASVAAEFERKFGRPPMAGLACPGLPAPVAVNAPDFDDRGEFQAARREGTVGKLLPNLVARIVRSDGAASAAVGEEGNLLIKGAIVPATGAGGETAAGWYETGVVAAMDEEGFVTV